MMAPGSVATSGPARAAAGTTVAETPSLRDVPFSNRAAGLRRLETFVSSYAGIVSDAHELLRRPGDLGLVRFGAVPTTSSELLGPSLAHLQGSSGGVGASRAEARAAAVGELLERYSASWTPPDSVIATAEELGPEAVAPESFALFAPEQYADPAFPFATFTRRTRLRWLRGFALPDGEPAWLPAQLVLLAQTLADGEPPLDDQSSSGLACGQTLEEAVLTGLFEVLERDAFLLAWLNRLSLPLVDWHDDPELTRLAARAFDPVRAPYDVVDLSAFWGVPTMMGVVRGRPGDGAAVGVGAASAATPQAALVKALGEAFCVRTWLLYLREDNPWEPVADPDAVQSFSDHVCFYGDEDRLPRASFLWASPERRRLDELPALAEEGPFGQIRELCARIGVRGYRAYAVDVTSPDVAAGGLRVARAVVPGLVCMDADHRRRHLGGLRVLRGAAEAGLGPLLGSAVELNPDPHPFP
jgi:ribosomal protein S12 methylthiotransferase accessory factor